MSETAAERTSIESRLKQQCRTYHMPGDLFSHEKVCNMLYSLNTIKVSMFLPFVDGLEAFN